MRRTLLAVSTAFILLFTACHKDSSTPVTATTIKGPTVEGIVVDANLDNNLYSPQYVDLWVRYPNYDISYFILKNEYYALPHRYVTGDKYVAPSGCFKITSVTITPAMEGYEFFNGIYKCLYGRINYSSNTILKVGQDICY